MNFLDPFSNNQQQQVPSPAKRSNGMNYGGAQQRTQYNQQPQPQIPQQQQQKQRQPTTNTVGMGALSMLDPLANSKGPVVREQSKAVSDIFFSQKILIFKIGPKKNK